MEETPPQPTNKNNKMKNLNTNINFATATKAQLEAAGFTMRTIRGQRGKKNTLKSTRFNGKTSNLR